MTSPGKRQEPIRQAFEQRRRRSHAKKLLLSMVVLGLVGLVVGGGSFATFNAQTTNPSNTFSTGTLVLSNQRDSGTACLSTGGGFTDVNVNSTGCDDLIAGVIQKPGDSTSHTVTIKHVGSIDATTTELWSAGCATDDNGEAFHGTGDLCNRVTLTIHDDTNDRCVYPTAVFGTPEAGPCSASESKTLADFAASAASSHVTLGSLAADASLAFTLVAGLPSSADNSYQGREATIDFNWQISQ